MIRPRRWATGNHHGCLFVGRGVFSSTRRMKRANRVRRIPIASDAAGKGVNPMASGERVGESMGLGTGVMA
jgi:hypothetical protein